MPAIPAQKCEPLIITQPDGPDIVLNSKRSAGFALVKACLGDKPPADPWIALSARGYRSAKNAASLARDFATASHIIMSESSVPIVGMDRSVAFDEVEPD